MRERCLHLKTYNPFPLCALRAQTSELMLLLLPSSLHSALPASMLLLNWKTIAKAIHLVAVCIPCQFEWE